MISTKSTPHYLRPKVDLNRAKNLHLACWMNLVNKKYIRTPKFYDGTAVTIHRLADVIPQVLSKVREVHSQSPDLIMAAWPQILGPQFADMTHAFAFKDGVLFVRVKNSTLHSLLSTHEKARILKLMREKFPGVEIKNILFRMG